MRIRFKNKNELNVISCVENFVNKQGDQLSPVNLIITTTTCEKTPLEIGSMLTEDETSVIEVIKNEKILSTYNDYILDNISHVTSDTKSVIDIILVPKKQL